MKQRTQTRRWLPAAVNGIALLPMIAILSAAAMTIADALTSVAFLGVAGIMGDLSLALFTAMLACMPLNIVFGWTWPLALKKPLGLYAFMYSAVHYLVFMSGFGFSAGAALGATVASNMLLFGFLAVALMVPLALTSNKWSMRKLGRNWKRLHWLTYAVAIFIVLHLIFLGQGVLTAVTYAILLGVRIAPVRRAMVEWRQGRKKRVSIQAAATPQAA